MNLKAKERNERCESGTDVAALLSGNQTAALAALVEAHTCPRSDH